MKATTLILAAIFLCGVSNAQQELLDTSYGVNGQAIVDFLDRDETRSTAIDASDRLLIAGTHLFTSNSDLYVCRLNTDGTIDESFASNGVTPGFFQFVTESSTGRANAPLIRVLSSGKIIVGMTFAIPITGTPNIELVPYILRLNSAGTLDTSFGTNGYVVLSGTTVIADICEGINAELYVSSIVNPFSNAEQTRLARISSDGQSIDESFANEALEQVSAPYFRFEPRKIIHAGDKLYMVNQAQLPNPQYPQYGWTTARYLVVWQISLDDDQLITNYGDNGSFTYHITEEPITGSITNYSIADAVVNSDNNVLVTLISYGNPTPAFLLKIGNNGQLRSDFYDAGVMTFNYPASSCNKFSMFAKHPNNGYYVMSYNIGVLDDCASGTISICQINDDGEPLFMEGGIDGSIEIQEGFTVHLPELQVQSDGKLLLTSFYFPNQHNNETNIKSIRIHTDHVSSVHEEELPKVRATLDCYPNPATNYLRVNLDIPQHAAQNGPVELVMHDLQGRVVYRQNHPELHFGEVSIDVSQFPSGLYTLHCTVNGVWVDGQKVMVE